MPPLSNAENSSQLFGSHLSVAGGLEQALFAAQDLGFNCVQVFVKNQRQWRAPPLSVEKVETFLAARRRSPIAPVVAHASYLINLCSPDRTVRRRGVAALLDEVNRCDALEIPYLVVHPGASLGANELSALSSVSDSLDEVAGRRSRQRSLILLETTAGQGSSIGHRLEQLAEIRANVNDAKALGFCLDTCHLFAAGYDFRSLECYQALMAQIESVIGLSSVRCIHLNDSKRELGSRVDRHEHIGQGKIGKAGISHFVNDPRFTGIPMILETPKGADARGIDYDRSNLKRLRAMMGAGPSAASRSGHLPRKSRS